MPPLQVPRVRDGVEFTSLSQAREVASQFAEQSLPLMTTAVKTVETGDGYAPLAGDSAEMGARHD